MENFLFLLDVVASDDESFDAFIQAVDDGLLGDIPTSARALVESAKRAPAHLRSAYLDEMAAA